MLREKEIENFRQNILPYYTNLLEEQEEFERLYQERKAISLKRQQELEQAKLLRLEQKRQEQARKKAERDKEKEQRRIEREQQREQAKIEKKLASGKYKRCSRCGEVLKLKEFYRNPLKSLGVFDYCKACAKLARMQNYLSKEEREKIKQNALNIMLGIA